MALYPHQSEVVKASGNSDDNKKKFFEIVSHILKNLGLFQELMLEHRESEVVKRAF